MVTQAVPILQRRQFTVDEYYQMGRSQILSWDERLELIEGEITQMTPSGSRHAACVDRVTCLFYRSIQSPVSIRVQNPLRLSVYNEPEPDIVLLEQRLDFYEREHPAPDDALLLVEVSDASLMYDRQIKIPLYVRYGVQEVWLINLEKNNIEVYRNPSPQGYQNRQIISHGQTLTPQSFPTTEFQASDFFG